MAHQKNKKQHLSNEKQSSTPTPTSWPNLPQPILNLIVAQPTLMHSISSFGCVTKTWRSPSKKCRPNGKPRWPRLVEINGKERVEHHGNARSHRCTIKFHDVCPYPYWPRRRKENIHEKYYNYQGIKYFKGHSHGQVVYLSEDMSVYLWHSSTFLSTRFLPNWNPKIDFKVCTLSSWPPECRGSFSAMVLTGSSSPAFAFYRWGGEHDDGGGWIMEDCDVKERYDDEGKNMQFSSAVGFEGKFYALSLQGSVVVIEEVGSSCYRITGVGGNRAVPSKVSRQYREFLVECDGEILVVFLVSKKLIDVVDDVEVFRLDVGELLWVKMEGIGDRALFVEDECCMGVDARRVGCNKNCVYFTHHGVDNWLVFNMESGQISPLQESVMWDEAILEFK